MSSAPTNQEPTPLTIARGDGIGPEIMDAVLRILEAAQARLAIEEIEIGEQVYRRGLTSGIAPESWDSLRRTGLFLKAPITTPQGGGYKSLNVTIRKTLGLFANVRPCVSYDPFVATLHPHMDLVIVRENEEDTYAGIEHQQTDEVTQCLKLITRPGCERIVRYAFEYARMHNRKKVTCFSKDNIMKFTDGLFHKVFDEIAPEYPTIKSEHWIIDIGTALIADQPREFDVVLCPNLYGDIVSDVAAQIAGSVGMAGSANIGDRYAMFEAIHGSAPTIAGQDVANPSALLHAAIMMLVHIDQPDVAEVIHNAWLRTIEDGVHTADVYSAPSSDKYSSKEKVGTKGFADAVIARLGDKPERLAAVSYRHAPRQEKIFALKKYERKAKKLVGVDVFLHWDEAERVAAVLGEKLAPLAGDKLKLKIITNRGVLVYPGGYPETFRTDHWRCRFVHQTEGEAITPHDVLDLLKRVHEAGFDFIKTEHLYYFDDERAYSLGQGE